MDQSTLVAEPVPLGGPHPVSYILDFFELQLQQVVAVVLGIRNVYVEAMIYSLDRIFSDYKFTTCRASRTCACR